LGVTSSVIGRAETMIKGVTLAILGNLIGKG
jgi:hypothetical protein